MRAETLFRALADPTRLRILRLLGSMELAVSEIAQALGQSQPRVSRHIGILCDAGLSERRREGSWIFLRATPDLRGATQVRSDVARLLAKAETFDREFHEQCEADRAKLAEIRVAREAQAQEYFASHAHDWDELRRLHSSDEQIEQALADALGEGRLGRLLDIGTGTGRMAELLAGKADHIVALDKSLAMLRVARAKLQHISADRLEVIQGDFTSLPFAPDSFDTVLFHQVLHFANSPAAALNEAARVTAAGGRIGIVDFDAHQHEEFRVKHAHARLGFAEEQMHGLLREAGFEPQLSILLEGGEIGIRIWIAQCRHGEGRTVG